MNKNKMVDTKNIISQVEFKTLKELREDDGLKTILTSIENWKEITIIKTDNNLVSLNDAISVLLKVYKNS